MGAWLTILMQVLILLTSNHNYANFLVLALCLFLFDDRDVARVIPKSLAGRLSSRTAGGHSATGFSRASMAAIASAIVIASLLQAWSMVSGRRAPDPVAAALDHLRPFRIVNNYHVFPTMKTERIELVIEGSMDGLDWRVYEFKYKPGDVRRRPEVVVPHHPRLDWLMWFVPMHPAFLPFFDNFMQRLAEASPSVLDLLQTDPFPGQAPRYLRVSVYRYRFTSPDTRAVTGEWWQREYLGPFFPLPGMEGKK